MRRKEYIKRCAGFMLMLTLFVFGAMYIFTYQHEFIHKEIWGSFGCESNMTIYPGWGVTETDCSMTNITELEYLFIFESNKNNEIAGYNTLYIGYVLMGLFMLFITILFLFPFLFKSPK